MLTMKREVRRAAASPGLGGVEPREVADVRPGTAEPRVPGL